MNLCKYFHSSYNRSSSLTTASCPCITASDNSVWPLSSLVLRSLWCWSSSWTIASYPCIAASDNGVWPLSFLALGSLPCISSRLIVSSSPASTSMCNKYGSSAINLWIKLSVSVRLEWTRISCTHALMTISSTLMCSLFGKFVLIHGESKRQA